MNRFCAPLPVAIATGTVVLAAAWWRSYNREDLTSAPVAMTQSLVGGQAGIPEAAPAPEGVTEPVAVSAERAGAFQDIGSLEKGSEIDLPLPDGGSLAVRLNYVNRYENGAAAAGGDVLDGSGTFEIGGEPWGYRGFILQRHERIAHVFSSGPDGGLQVARRPIGEVICEPEPGWPTQPLARNDGPDLERAAIYNGGQSVGIIYETIPLLSSLPRAQATIYLDFDGEVIEGQSWEGGRRIVAPAYNLPASEVEDMWRRVAEDFAPFEVNVTTDLQAYNRAPQGLRIRCITTTNNFASAGGVAFSNTFRESGEPVCWNFYRGAAGAVVISHEVGHTFGLHHDGRGGDGYFGGHGSGSTSWGPIMGAPYGSNITHWSKGEYVDANQQQDDLAYIGASAARRVDDHEPDLVRATPLTVGTGNSVSARGVIASPDDVDGFTFATTGGQISLQFSPAPGNPNLDIEAKLLNAAGTVLATASPSNQMGATINATVSSGNYLVTVDGVGNGTWEASGYNDYGSLGEYSISGTIASPVWRFRVPANSLTGTQAGVVAPGGAGYSITAGNTNNAFAIDSATGMLRVASPTALTANATFSLTVSHTQGGSPRTTTAQIRVAALRGLRHDIFTGLGGGGISGLTSNGNYPNNPAVTRTAGTIQGAYPANNYGQRFTGYLVPRESGSHTFWTTGDDAAELWLSTSENPAGKVRIAYNNSNSGPDEWTRVGTQQSAPISLVAGQRYYIEFLHRENAGGDHASAAWQTPTLSRRLIGDEYLEYPGTPPNRSPWLANMTFPVREDSATGTIFGTLLAGDFEPGSVLSGFAITGGNVGNAFAVNPSTGELRVNAALSFANRPKYWLDVRVTDSGGRQTTAQVAVEVEARAVKREYWAGIGGNQITNLTSNAAFPNSPTSVTYQPFFETPTNMAENYGQRLSGYVRAPETGSYTFWIASDDGGELWLSTDSTVANKRRIAWHTGATTPREWGKFATQRSATIQLEGGRFYYIEALHKEGAVDDNFAVSWAGPDFGQVMLGAPHVTQSFYNHGAPELADRTVQVYDRESLVTTLEAKDWADPGSTLTFAITGGNADGAFTIDPQTGEIRSSGGRLPTGNRALTITVTDNGPTPLSDTATVTVNVIKSSLKREVWTDLNADQALEGLTNSLYFPASPDGTGYVEHFDAPRNWGNNYGQRLSGYVVPPVSGNYTFWIASDDGGELRLSTDASPANTRRIAGVSGSVAYQSWTSQSGQQSGVIPLVAGQRYYIEALQKEGGGDDHLSVAWQGPGLTRTRIASDHLEYPDTYRPALKREVWFGSSSLSLPATPPGFTGTMFDFRAPTNTGDNYSQRITTLLVPPVSGDYTFWLASDDDGLLRISTDETAARLTNAASVSGYVDELQWDIQPSQRSATRRLVAGKRYYMEVRHREGTGGDHVAVAWQGPGILRQIIPNSVLEHPATPADRSQIQREVWNAISGESVANLTGSANFPGSPSTVTTLAAGAGLAAGTNVADNFGQRLSGYLVPPTHGRYTFWIASDNSSELWLSPDGNPANRVRIASVNGVVPALSWDAQTGQKSVPLALEAGRRYYIEVLHKDGTAADHLAVAWQGPGFARKILPGRYLEHPLSIPGTPSVRRELWTAISGGQTTALTANTAYRNGTPAARGVLTAFEAPPEEADQFGQRLCARLTVPESGNYRFWIAGDDTAELWLSPDENRANRVRIARAPSATTFREWDKFPEQASSVLPLVAGRTYFIEALHKDQSTGDHVSVAWEGTSLSRRVLDGSYLGYPGAQPDNPALKREIWTGVGGNNVSNLTGLTAYPNSPNQRLTLQTPDVPPDWGENYGQKISGYLIAPRTGDYKFWLSSDDGSQLWLATNGNPASKALVASVANATGYRNWTSNASQESAVIGLTAGQRCYFEILHKEGGGGDYVTANWEGPDFTRQDIRAEFFEYPEMPPGDTIPGAPLTASPTDPAYAFWADFHSLTAGNRGDLADPDGDGLSNRLEFVLGTAPGTATAPEVMPALTLETDRAVFVFRRSDVSANAGPVAEYGTLLGSWTPAIHGVGEVTVQITENGFGAGIDRVTVTVPRSGDRLFLRLNAGP